MCGRKFGIRSTVLVFCTLIMAVGCSYEFIDKSGISDMSDQSNTRSSNGNVQSFKINESGPVTLTNLAANNVLAVAVNKTAGYTDYSNSGGVTAYTLNGIKHQVALAGRAAGGGVLNASELDAPLAEVGDRIPLQYDKAEASDFNANPLPIPPVSRTRSAQAFEITPSKLGDKRLFWLNDADKAKTWQEKQATLAAVSNRAEIWIMDENFDDSSASAADNKLTTLQARALAEKFDAIYQYTTPVFGFEYGGGSNNPQPIGGVDGNTKILILVYDIDANSASSGTSGYFWSKDHYTNEYLQSQKSGYKSNNAEIFYIDSYWADSYPNTIYSTLIHEFVHMINFNEKFVVQNKSYNSWYTEMLAMLGEDVIGPLVGINPGSSGHPIKSRIPYTLGMYSYDPTYWAGFISYGITYGFGAYLVRNYGGTALIKEIARNNKTNIDSISLALSVFNPSMDFTKAVERYYEAFICNDTGDRGMASFNKTITNTINGNEYVLYGFDIYQMNRVNVALNAGFISYWGSTEKGPYLYSLTQNYLLDHYSFILLSCADWQNVSGDLVVDMKRPASSSVNLHLIVN